ncbi:MAG: glycosyltransferase, partial [Myxococcales bacterium]|nr:glycosyltransferase [Myxococcales bacterium]
MKILQLFNRYQAKGGEEKSAGRIFDHLSLRHEVEQLWWDSADWTGTSGPSRFGQMCRLFYNWDSARELRSRIRSFRPDTLLCHNLYPVGSPAVYKVALDTGIPVIQFIHNFRPFSVGGGAWAGGQVMADGLRGRFIPEVCAGAWQGSILKSALFGLMLKSLHLSGWLRAVSCWVAISDFMRKKFVEAGVDSEQIVVLRHSWDMISRDAIPRDEGYYLFLSRLVPEKGVQTLLRAWEL